MPRPRSVPCSPRISRPMRPGPRSCLGYSRVMSRQNSAKTCSIMMICCSTGRKWRPSRPSPPIWGGRFDHILVDEYQDTNRLQSSILLALKPGWARA
ncbi:MAG: UvrD-helicase domain-containing protein [Aliidongia sp.]